MAKLRDRLCWNLFMRDSHFKIVYDGDALQNSEMDINELAPALMAVGSLIESANAVLNGNDAKVSVRVRGSFKAGCFGVELSVVQTLTGIMSDLVGFFNGNGVNAVLNAKDLLSLLGFLSGSGATIGLIQLIKRYAGKKPSTVEKLSDGNVTMTFQGESITVQNNVYNLYMNSKVREDLDRVIYQPLTKEGLDTFCCGTDTDIYESVSKSESSYFKSPPPTEEQLPDVIYTKVVQLSRVEFTDAGKAWYVTDGGSPFPVKMQCPSFLKRVESSEIGFSKADQMFVRIRQQQRLVNGKIKSEYAIEEVLEYIPAKQMTFDFQGSDESTPDVDEI